MSRTLKLTIILTLVTSAVLAGGLLTPHMALSAGTGGSGGGGGGGGGGAGGGGGGTGGGDVSGYLSNLYLWFLGFVGIAALFALVYGGVMYMFSGANLTKVDQAKKWISNAIWGIVLAAISFLLLRTINPDLIQGFDLETILESAKTPEPTSSPATARPFEDEEAPLPGE